MNSNLKTVDVGKKVAAEHFIHLDKTADKELSANICGKLADDELAFCRVAAVSAINFSVSSASGNDSKAIACVEFKPRIDTTFESFRINRAG